MGAESNGESDSHVVLAALKGFVTPYPIAPEVDWNKVANIYGKRFRNGKLFRIPTAVSHDLALYPWLSYEWVIVAEDVTNPERTIVDCMMKEIRAARNDPQHRVRSLAENRSLFTGGQVKIPFADYLKISDPILLLQKGVIVVFEDHDRHERLEESSKFLTTEELEELKNSLIYFTEN